MRNLVSWFRGLFLKRQDYIVPSYSEVMSTLTAREITEAFRCLEVVSYASGNKSYAYNRLHSICNKYNWSYAVFTDIIREEYYDLHCK